jgi:hypothetical protein
MIATRAGGRECWATALAPQRLTQRSGPQVWATEPGIQPWRALGGGLSAAPAPAESYRVAKR